MLGLRCWDQVSLELDFVSFDRVDGPDGLQHDSERRRATVAVVSLAGVRAQVAEGDTTDKKGVVAELFITFR